MAKKKSAPKAKMGRPAKVHGVASVNVRIPASTDAAINRWAKDTGVSRADAVRQLLELGLKAKR